MAVHMRNEVATLTVLHAILLTAQRPNWMQVIADIKISSSWILALI